MFVLALTSMKDDAPTFDEQGFLVRGLAYLRGDANGGNRNLRVGHPLGLNILNAALLNGDSTVRLPSDHPSWQGTDFHRPAELFLWEIGNDVEHIMYLARLPTIWLGLLLAAVGGRWAAEMAAGWRKPATGNAAWPQWAGFMTLLMLALDPNILAHTRLVTTDLGLTAAAGLAGFTLWRFLKVPDWSRAIVAGIGLGLLLNTKFTALLFLPLFGIVIVIGLVRHRHTPSPDNITRFRDLILQVVVVYPAVAFIILWAGNGFQISPLSTPLPLIGQTGSAPIPLAGYLDQLLDIGNRLAMTTPSFLLGNYSDSGWWYYFPVAFLLKTPLPILLLLVWALGRVCWLVFSHERDRSVSLFDILALLIPACGYFAIALTTTINLGYRHLLPILPFLYVLIGTVVSQSLHEQSAHESRVKPRLAAVLLGWFVVASLWMYPYYLAFFNLLAGGPDNGWRALVDSNIDWGQDLKRLGDWLGTSGVESVWLSYFGEARPEYYGIDYTGLDSYPPRLMNPNARPFYPSDPAPGWYAISATTLQGVHFADHDQFAFFRSREPQDKIGHSIFMFDQPKRGTPVNLMLGDLQVDQLLPEDFGRLETNDVLLRWFDPQTSLILPLDDRPLWIALGDRSLDPDLAPYVEMIPIVDYSVTSGYSLSRATATPSGDPQDIIELRSPEGQVNFSGLLLNELDGSTWRGITNWQQMGEPQPIKIFIHILDSEGRIMAQWDGISAEWEGWRTGDTLFQVHEIPLDGLPSGTYRVVAGLYNPENMYRWQSVEGKDVIELGSLMVP